MVLLDIEKYEFSVLGIKYLILLGIISLIPKNFPGIYIQIGIDLIAENRNMNPNLINWSFLFIKRLSEGLHKSDSYSN